MERWSHILVVDRNLYIRERVGQILQTRTRRITGVADRRAMYELLRIDDSVDLVIMDGSRDRSSSDALHLKRLGIPLVIMSGEPDMTLFAVENGLQLVAKPFKPSQLRGATQWAVIPQQKSRARRDAHHR